MTTLDIPSLNPGDIYTICKNPKYLSDYRVVVHNDIVNDKVTVMEIEPYYVEIYSVAYFYFRGAKDSYKKIDAIPKKYRHRANLAIRLIKMASEIKIPIEGEV